jgi:hypothetical protein
LIELGDARGHETGKQGNRFAKPGQEKLRIVRAISVGRIDTEVCEVTAGASSPATTAPQSRVHSNNLADLQHAHAARSPTTVNASWRSAKVTAAASSKAAIACRWA